MGRPEALSDGRLRRDIQQSLNVAGSSAFADDDIRACGTSLGQSIIFTIINPPPRLQILQRII
jgi:hypothetical protein